MKVFEFNGKKHEFVNDAVADAMRRHLTAERIPFTETVVPDVTTTVASPVPSPVTTAKKCKNC